MLRQMLQLRRVSHVMSAERTAADLQNRVKRQIMRVRQRLWLHSRLRWLLPWCYRSSMLRWRGGRSWRRHLLTAFMESLWTLTRRPFPGGHGFADSTCQRWATQCVSLGHIGTIIGSMMVQHHRKLGLFRAQGLRQLESSGITGLEMHFQQDFSPYETARIKIQPRFWPLVRVSSMM